MDTLQRSTDCATHHSRVTVDLADLVVSGDVLDVVVAINCRLYIRVSDVMVAAHIQNECATVGWLVVMLIPERAFYYRQFKRAV